MTAATKVPDRLLDRLPPVRGTYHERFDLSRITWLRVGGPAEVMFRPADQADLTIFLSTKPADVPVTVIGVGSNLLVRDGGVPGVVIRLGRTFATVEFDGTHVGAGAGALDVNVAKACRDANIAGLEFLSGVPGTIGGALRMNAGAYGRELKDVVIGAEAVDGSGQPRSFTAQELGLDYRHSTVATDIIYTRVWLHGHAGMREEIAERMKEIGTAREASQPIRNRTGGSTFINPGGPDGDPKAWELIEAAGCRGLRCGNALVSEKHCNFLINNGGATAADLEYLGEEVRRRVRDTSGIQLEWEIRRIGVPMLEACS